MKSFTLGVAVCFSLCFTALALWANDTGPISGGRTNSATGTNSTPAFKMKSTSLRQGGTDFGNFVTIKAGNEYIGVHLPVGCRIQSENEGKRLFIYLNDVEKNWLKLEFQTEELPEFNADTAFTLVNRYFGSAPNVRSPAVVFGKPSFIYTSKIIQAGSETQVRAQVIQCKTGLLTVATTAYGTNAKNVVFTMQRIVTSLQLADSEKGLVVPKPVPES